jgi:hypothetical protein
LEGERGRDKERMERRRRDKEEGERMKRRMKNEKWQN